MIHVFENRARVYLIFQCRCGVPVLLLLHLPLLALVVELGFVELDVRGHLLKHLACLLLELYHVPRTPLLPLLVLLFVPLSPPVLLLLILLAFIMSSFVLLVLLFVFFVFLFFLLATVLFLDEVFIFFFTAIFVVLADV